MLQDFLTTGQKIPFFSMKEYLNDQSSIPKDIVSPRILTQRSLLVLGGPPKIGKSDFLISWLVHMAAGVSFLGMTPSRPLKIFYMQTEIEYEYMKERLQCLQLDPELLAIAANNLIITPKVHLSFCHEEINYIKEIAKERFKPDILAVDPLRNIFNSEYGNENDNSAMLFFLQKTLEKLRNAINPNAGIILTHHTKKLSKKMLEEDPFQGLSGAGSLRGFYTTGMVMVAYDEESTRRQIVFELRNGERVPNKLIDKINGSWQLLDQWNN
ncbi:putative phage related protein [Wolbachia endosymbiont of Culex quinquefasciatus JHB]|nr:MULTISPECIES: AAA family ATPase [unclassified Wolbachia]EEB55286.1 putative phage related protein [Wolbachia endosymbiont of Culex quinquefasciatus JHB]EEB55429.1 putative phage related protein [Wolbachia endosymbiont of Culex quinquefasciatus JHB]CAQ55424.1 putative phage related protein [Wolbachia endosymbiont of Culex quinquefasciatus Pel]CQD11002.1 putative phage related protein [Wolbachia endosymbiont wPip_Mol of Culex molestus]